MGISMKTTSGKILASVALVGSAAAVAGMGTYGAFTGSTTTVDQAVSAGTVNIDFGTTDTNTLSVPVAGLLPGDSVEKFVTLTNSGNSGLNTISLTTATVTSSLLTSDPTDGLQLTIESCSGTWTTVANAADTCAGTVTSVLATRAIIGQGLALDGLESVIADTADAKLKITTGLPTTADDDFQGLTDSVSFTFDATQRTEQVK